MARRLIDSLVGPDEGSYVDRRSEDSPRVKAVTGGREKRKAGPREFGVRVRKPDTISAPRIGAVQRAYDAIERTAPNLRPAVQGFEDLTGLRETYDALIRGASSALGSDVYEGQNDLRESDALNLGITGLAGPVLKGAGALGRMAVRKTPQGVRNLAARGKKYLTEAAPLAEARPTYVRGQEGPFTTIARSDLAAQPIPEATETSSLAALRSIAQDRTRSPAIRAADTSALEARGVPYDETAPLPVSSLQRQAGIGRAYSAAVEGSPEYKSALFERYGEMFPEVVEKAKAQNLDQLTEAAYRQLGEEVTGQFDTLPLRFKYHEGPGEYGSSTEMIQDALGRGQLNVFSGGEPHEFLNRIDPATGLSQNEMFRAVHDYMGHVVPGSRFGPSGEEIAYAAHSQQLSPLAQMALLSETRGQNSFVNYTPVNAGVIKGMNTARKQLRELDLIEKSLNRPMTDAQRVLAMRDAKPWLDALPSREELQAQLRELGQQTQYAPQRAVLLPPEYLDPMTAGGTPDWLRPLLNNPDAVSGVRGVHISRAPDLQATDPSFFGTGHRGAEYAGVTRDKRPLRTYFYSGDEGTVIPEDAVLGADASGQLRQGPRYAYETELGNLYDLNADPSGLRALSDAYNLPFYKTTVPPYLIDFMKDTSLEGRALIPDAERLVRDFGYSGYLAGEGPQRAAAAVYDPVSGLKPIERGPKGYAEGGHASGYSA